MAWNTHISKIYSDFQFYFITSSAYLDVKVLIIKLNHAFCLHTNNYGNIVLHVNKLI